METKRLYYVDWLRVLVVLSLIPYHAALTYLRFGTVYIKAPVSGLAALPFLAVVVPLGDFFMSLLFFASGIASYYSFQKRGSGAYVRERARKLMLPFLLGFLLLCPVVAYLQALYEGFSGGFLSFIPQFFGDGIIYYHGYGHLWFLFYLFIFSVLCVPIFNRWVRKESHIRRIGSFLSKGHHMLLPLGAILLLELLLRPFFHGDQTLVFDWANDAVYLSIFIFGYLFAAEERIRNKLREYFKLSILCGMLSLAVLFYVNVRWQVMDSDEVYLTLLWVLAKGIYECSAIIFLINGGRVYLNKNSKAVRYLNGASFMVYIFHFLPVTFFTWLFIKLKLPIFIKFLLVVVLSYLAVFLMYELWRRVAVLKERISGKSNKHGR